MITELEEKIPAVGKFLIAQLDKEVAKISTNFPQFKECAEKWSKFEALVKAEEVTNQRYLDKKKETPPIGQLDNDIYNDSLEKLDKQHRESFKRKVEYHLDILRDMEEIKKIAGFNLRDFNLFIAYTKIKLLTLDDGLKLYKKHSAAPALSSLEETWKIYKIQELDPETSQNVGTLREELDKLEAPLAQTKGEKKKDTDMLTSSSGQSIGTTSSPATKSSNSHLKASQKRRWSFPGLSNTSTSSHTSISGGTLHPNSTHAPSNSATAPSASSSSINSSASSTQDNLFPRSESVDLSKSKKQFSLASALVFMRRTSWPFISSTQQPKNTSIETEEEILSGTERTPVQKNTSQK